MKHAMPVERATVVGRYELVGINGCLLPAWLESDETGADTGRYRVMAGELRLEGNGTYVLEITAQYDPPGAAAWVRTISSGGTWRFLPSALDRTSGEVRLASGLGQTSAALAGVSLVHRLGQPDRHPRARAYWVYIRR
ncbi:MAG TPA: hypothetical protein VHG35_14865 [Gemmatimonadales bacterium]|nr:hypothetical protein [Gemmatimonadales bacterium]